MTETEIMANTKKLSREERKKSKRTSRQGLKKLFQTLNRKQRAEFRKEKQGLKPFVAKLQAAAEGE